MDRAIPLHHPQVGLVLVFLGIDLADGIDDPLAIRRDHRPAHTLQLRQIVQRDVALLRRIGGKGRVQKGSEDSKAKRQK